VAREPDKLSFTRLKWDDPELLLRVVEERYVVSHGTASDPAEMWHRYFGAQVRGVPMREYLVSRILLEASRAKLQEMSEQRLNQIRLCALLIDATPFAGQQMVVAMGITQDGRKKILGLRQGATENATVVGELLGDLLTRGLDFTQPRLYVLDGGKALTTAVKKYAGEGAPIQRCQVHKRRNLLDHLTEEQKPAIAKRLNTAYAMEDHTAAHTALKQLLRELMDLNPSAARSLKSACGKPHVRMTPVPPNWPRTLARKPSNQATDFDDMVSVLHARVKTPSGACRKGCGFASRARQSNDFGWCTST
jgi:hypothetical protein